MTDSTDRLLHVNASSFEVLRTVRINDPRLDHGNGRSIYGVNELELVSRVAWQQMTLAPVALQVCEMFLGGLAVEVVKDRNAFTAS